MILLRFREKIPLRIAEWLGGLAMILIGLYLVIWPTAFERAGFRCHRPSWRMGRCQPDAWSGKGGGAGA